MDMHYGKADLEAKLWLAYTRTFSDAELEAFQAQVHQEQSHSVQGTILTFAALFLAGGVISTQTVHKEEAPATWWDHFKLRWFPQRLLRRYPADTREIKTEVHEFHTCPHKGVIEKRPHVDWMLGDAPVIQTAEPEPSSELLDLREAIDILKGSLTCEEQSLVGDHPPSVAQAVVNKLHQARNR